MTAVMYAKSCLFLLSAVGPAWSATVSDFSMSIDFHGRTSLKVGEVATVTATAVFPKGKSADTNWEIIASTDPTIYAIRELKKDTQHKGPDVTAINSLWANDSTLHLGMDQNEEDAITYKTRGVLPVGSLETSSNTEAGNKLSIDYELVLVSMGSYNDGDEYCTAAGAEYNGQTRIYVVQNCLKIYSADIGSVTKPLFTFPYQMVKTEIEVLTPLTIPLEMRMTYPEANITVTVSVTDGDLYKVGVVKMETRSVGDAFTYSVDASKIKTEAFATCPLPEMPLYMGKFINSVSWNRTDEASDIIVDVTLQATDWSIVGNVVTVAVSVRVNDREMYVQSTSLTGVFSSGNIKHFAQDGSFNLQSPTETPIVPAGFAATALLDIETPPMSSEAYTIQLRTQTENVSAGGLRFVAVNPWKYGSNLPCPITNLNIDSTNSSEMGDFVDSVEITFNISNLGHNESTGADVNRLTLELAVMMMSGVEEDTVHDLIIDVNELGSQTTSFKAGPEKAFDSPVDYVIDIKNKCSDEYESGSTVTTEITVKTVRDKTSGPFEIEWSIPPYLNESALVPVEVNVVSKGRNVPCVQLGPMPFNTSKWAFNASKWENASLEEDDRAVAMIPMVCNIQQSTDAAEDNFVILIKARIKDTPEVLNATGNTPFTFGIGIQYSKHQIWVATLSFNVKPPRKVYSPGREQAQLVTGLKLSKDCMPKIFPGDIMFQFSMDNVKYYDLDPSRYQWAAKSPSDSSVTVMLKTPFTAPYVRVVNKQGGCMCVQDILKTTAGVPEMYGPRLLSRRFMSELTLALDNNDDTCITMPQRDAADTTPYFWMDTPTANLGLTGASRFNVTMLGENIQCHNRYGPQVTYLAFPKQTAVSFHGKRVLCTSAGNSTVSTTLTQCDYECACAGAAQCERFMLLMLHAVPGNQYRLCEIKFYEN